MATFKKRYLDLDVQRFLGPDDLVSLDKRFVELERTPYRDYAILAFSSVPEDVCSWPDLVELAESTAARLLTEAEDLGSTFVTLDDLAYAVAEVVRITTDPRTYTSSRVEHAARRVRAALEERIAARNNTRTPR